MSNLIKLTKINLLTFFDLYKVKNAKDNKEKQKALRKVILILLLFIYFGFVIYKLADQLMGGLVALEIPNVILGLFMMFTSVFLIFTNILKISGILYNNRDYELLMGLPIKRNTIIISKVVELYIMNIVYTLLLMIPATIAYVKYVNVNVIFYILDIFTILLIPLIPLVISCILGTLLTSVFSKMKHKNWGQLILTIILIFGIMIINEKLTTISQIDMANMAASLMKSLNNYYPLVGIYMDIMTYYNLLSLLIFTGLPFAIFYLFLIILSGNYEKINSKLNSTSIHNKFILKRYKKNSPLKALYKKEISRYFASPNYVINTCFGAIFSVIAIVLFMIVGGDKLDTLIDVPGFSDLFTKTTPLLLGAFAVMNCTTYCSISLEGKNLWIVKSIPAEPLTIFMSKILVNLTIIVPVIVVDSILLSIYLKLKLLTCLFMIITPIAYAIFISIFGIVINMKFPTFDWKNEVYLVKQSVPSFIAIMVGMAFAIIPLTINYHFSDNLYITLITSIMLILDIIIYQYMKKNSVKEFNNL